MAQIIDKIGKRLTDRVVQLELMRLKEMGSIKSTGKIKTTTLRHAFVFIPNLSPDKRETYQGYLF
jgi:site-specific recombinase XerD